MTKCPRCQQLREEIKHLKDELKDRRKKKRLVHEGLTIEVKTDNDELRRELADGIQNLLYEICHPDEGKRIFVVTGSYQEFKFHVHGDARLMRAMKARRLHFVDSAMALKGMTQATAEIVKVGTYWEHPQWREIESELHVFYLS